MQESCADFCEKAVTNSFEQVVSGILEKEMVYAGYSSLHLADARADYPGKQTSLEHSAVMENGVRVWKEYETLFVDGEDFEEIGTAFESASDRGNESVSKSRLGNAEIRLMSQRAVVDFAVDWIEANRKN